MFWCILLNRRSIYYLWFVGMSWTNSFFYHNVSMGKYVTLICTFSYICVHFVHKMWMDLITNTWINFTVNPIDGWAVTDDIWCCSRIVFISAYIPSITSYAQKYDGMLRCAVTISPSPWLWHLSSHWFSCSLQNSCYLTVFIVEITTHQPEEAKHFQLFRNWANFKNLQKGYFWRLTRQRSLRVAGARKWWLFCYF